MYKEIAFYRIGHCKYLIIDIPRMSALEQSQCSGCWEGGAGAGGEPGTGSGGGRCCSQSQSCSPAPRTAALQHAPGTVVGCRQVRPVLEIPVQVLRLALVVAGVAAARPGLRNIGLVVRTVDSESWCAVCRWGWSRGGPPWWRGGTQSSAAPSGWPGCRPGPSWPGSGSAASSESRSTA